MTSPNKFIAPGARGLVALAICLLIACSTTEQPPPTVSVAQPDWTEESGPTAKAEAIRARTSTTQISRNDASAQSTALPIRTPSINRGDFAFAVSLAEDADDNGKRHMAALAASETAVLHANEVGYYVDTLDARLIQASKQNDLVVQRDENTLQLTLEGGDWFAAGEAVLSTIGATKLDGVAKVLADYDRTRITIAGYTDNLGEDAYNIVLSVRRANSIAELMNRSGVAAKRILLVGYGEAEPVASNDNDAGRARNRRVVIRIAPLQRVR